QRSRDPADGRAVRRAGRAEQYPAAGGAAADLERIGQDGDLHYALDRRGTRPERPGARHEPPAGPAEGRHPRALSPAPGRLRPEGRRRVRPPEPGDLDASQRGGGRKMMRESVAETRIVPDSARAIGPIERLTQSNAFRATPSPSVMLPLWDGLAGLGRLDARFFPGPSAVLQERWVMLASGELFVHAGYTLSRVAVGFVL